MADEFGQGPTGPAGCEEARGLMPLRSACVKGGGSISRNKELILDSFCAQFELGR